MNSATNSSSSVGPRTNAAELLMVESVLIAVTRITTFSRGQLLTNATGFFFERDGRLFVITNRHVVISESTGHRPDRIDLELHVNEKNIAEVASQSIPLYNNGQPVWRQAQDTSGLVDVVAIEINRSTLPSSFVFYAFNMENLVVKMDVIEVGTPLLIVGFPLGFHDTLHHLPVARQAIISSAFGLRFQGLGYFLTDARLHRGTSGAPVVTRSTRQSGRNQLPFLLLGVHSARLDAVYDLNQDERLALNVAWYSDVLSVLTDPNALTAPTPDAPKTETSGAPVGKQPAAKGQPQKPAEPMATQPVP